MYAVWRSHRYNAEFLLRLESRAYVYTVHAFVLCKFLHIFIFFCINTFRIKREKNANKIHIVSGILIWANALLLVTIVVGAKIVRYRSFCFSSKLETRTKKEKARRRKKLYLFYLGKVVRVIVRVGIETSIKFNYLQGHSFWLVPFFLSMHKQWRLTYEKKNFVSESFTVNLNVRKGKSVSSFFLKFNAAKKLFGVACEW